ncbi:MAG: NAD-dependent epimerase/dehydratase family protein [Candidatus Binatia bacterium]
MKFLKYLTFQVVIRAAADVLIVNVAYSVALMLRMLWRIANHIGRPAQVQMVEAVQIYVETFWVLTIIALAVYSMSGFYSWGRFYRGRFKALVIFQAVSLSYVLFGFVLYLSLARSWLEETPRSVLLIGWLLTMGLTTGARWWAKLWRRVLEREAPALRSESRQNGRIQHVLVIGGAGYIGSVLCRELLRQSYSVRVLDPLLYGQESLAELAGDPRFQLVEGDSRDVSAVFRAMLDMDAVVHLGELVGDPACAFDEKLTLEINLAATKMVAEAAQGCGVKRFIYASSCSVYGASSRTVDERSALNPVSVYARAKIGSEQALLALNGPNFHPVILRFATVYGRSPRPRFDLVINLLTAKAVCDGEITIFGGEQWRPFVHVADIAQAIVRCLAAPLESVKAEVFNVGSDEQNYTITEVGELIHRLIPEARLVNHGNGADNRDYHVSFARIRRELGFKPSYTVEAGVREIEAAFRAGQIQNYQDKRYSNYLTLTYPANFRSISSRNITELYAPPLLSKLAES